MRFVKTKTWFARLALLAVSSAMVLLAAEGVVRWLAPQQLIVIRSDIWIADHDGLGWKQASAIGTTINTGERTVRYRTDQLGHRIGDVDAPTERRLLAIGDSFLAAIQVDFDDTFPELLAARLHEEVGQRINIVNSGVAGWGPSHYLIKARQELRRSEYEGLLVFVFLGNDPEPERRDRFPPKLSNRVRNRLKLPASLERDEVLHSLAYPVNDLLETRSHLFMFARERLTYLLMRFGLSARRFHDVLLLSEVNSPRWQNTADALAELDAAARAEGAPALFVLLPGVYQVDEDVLIQTLRASGIRRSEIDRDQPNRLLLRLLHERGITVVDTTPAFREAHKNGGGPFFGHVDTHLSPAGHVLVANTIKSQVTQLLLESDDALSARGVNAGR